MMTTLWRAPGELARMAACATCVLAFTAVVRAEPLRVRATAGAAHALTTPQSQEFGWGGLAGLGVEYKVLPAVGLQVGMEALVLSADASPPPEFASQGPGRAFGALGSARFYLPPQVWIAVGAGYVQSGGLDRLGGKADIGYDVRFGDWAIGPFIGYRHVVEPNDSLRPADARIGTFGAQATWDPPTAPVDPDWDRDGVVNEQDACPRVAEDRDGFEDGDGCPDQDNDRDGVLDVADRCPTEAEDVDGFEDLDGCPDLDNDADGLRDPVDKCPNDPEDKDGFEDGDGCPDQDNDKDGMPDVRDQCPDEPETVNEYADEDGCPDEVSVRVVGESIRLDEHILFDYKKVTIRADSSSLVARMATLLTRHPEYLSISIEGHTDDPGTGAYNRRLSLARANAVRDALVGLGVDASRLSTVGHGDRRPLIRSKQPEQANRRVEFIIREKRTLDGRTIRNPAPPGSDASPESTESNR